MEVVQVMYMVIGGMLVFALGFIVLWVAGKDMLLAFKRKIVINGCEVYIATPTRSITHRYMAPKEGIFRIKKLPYVTNPEKTINLTQEERNIVMESLFRRQQRLQKRINEFKGKMLQIQNMIPLTKDERQKHILNSQLEHFKNSIGVLENKLRIKQENYFKDKRPAFFFIEGDPVPKDFYEFHSAMDSRMVDNLVSRAITQPQELKDKQAIDKKLKLIMLGCITASAIAAVICFRVLQLVGALCTHLGANCSAL